jgi:hypothetical protein
MPAMTAVTKSFPVPRSGSVPTLFGRGLSAYRQSVQTVQAGVRKARLFHVVTDGGVAGDIEITTPFSVATSCLALKTDGTYRAVTSIPKSTDPSIAVVSGLAPSTTYIVTVFGR